MGTDQIVDSDGERKAGSDLKLAATVSVTAVSNDSSSTEEEIEDHPFSNPVTAQYYRDIYEKAEYECRHHIDPDLTWTKQEERKLIRKIDWRVTLWAFIMFVALDIDRWNINAVTGSKKFFAEVGITTDQLNYGQTYFLVGFLLAELPSQLLSKWVGADRFIPAQLIAWSVCAIAQCQMKSPGAFYTLRVLLGVLEGGFIADTSLWMSYFYTNKEFVVRSGWFYLANPLTQAFSSLLAAAILNLDKRNGWSGWQYVFLIEGLITLSVGIAAVFLMPPSAVQTKTWYRPNGWFTDREEKIVVNRVIRDDPGKGEMNNRQGVGPKLLWKALKDFDIWPVYLCRLLADSGSSSGLGRYMPIIFSRLGFSAVHIDLLQVPYAIASCFTQTIECYLIGIFGQYGLVTMWVPLWNLPFIAALRWWPGFIKDQWTTYALIFLCLSGFTTPPALSAWASHNSSALRTRAVSLAVVNIASQLGSIVSSNLFRKDDAPRYERALQQMFAINLGALVLIFLTRTYYFVRNRQRDAKWNKYSEEEKTNYIISTTDEGNKRLDFRFVL